MIWIVLAGVVALLIGGLVGFLRLIEQVASEEASTSAGDGTQAGIAANGAQHGTAGRANRAARQRALLRAVHVSAGAECEWECQNTDHHAPHWYHLLTSNELRNRNDCLKALQPFLGGHY